MKSIRILFALSKATLIALMLSLPVVSFALGSSLYKTFYVRIKNQSDVSATISPGEPTDSWDCGNFCNSQTIPPNSSKDFKLTTKAYDNLYSSYSGIQTLNVTYGEVSAEIQMWVDHKHEVNTNVKTAIVGRCPSGFVSSSSLIEAGVGTNSDSVIPDIYVEDIKSGIGVTHITLTLLK